MNEIRGVLSFWESYLVFDHIHLFPVLIISLCIMHVDGSVQVSNCLPAFVS